MLTWVLALRHFFVGPCCFRNTLPTPVKTRHERYHRGNRGNVRRTRDTPYAAREKSLSQGNSTSKIHKLSVSNLDPLASNLHPLAVHLEGCKALALPWHSFVLDGDGRPRANPAGLTYRRHGIPVLGMSLFQIIEATEP